MIAAWLASSALAWELCAPAPAVHVAGGPDLFDVWPAANEDGQFVGIDVEGVDPGWSGYGWDQQLLLGAGAALPCARLGVREQVVWSHVTDTTLWSEDRFTGYEMHFGTSAMLGGEVRLPAWFAAGAYALPGVRTAVVGQRAVLEDQDLDRSITRLTFVPTLSAYAVVRWIPDVSPVGVHADLELPVVNLFQEIGWYPHRFFGAGLDVVLGRRSAPRVEPVGERGPGEPLDQVAAGGDLELDPEVVGEAPGLVDAGDPVPPSGDDPDPVR